MLSKGDCIGSFSNHPGKTNSGLDHSGRRGAEGQAGVVVVRLKGVTNKICQ